MDVEETWERVRAARDLCASPIDRSALDEALEAIEYLQDLLARLDEWIDMFAYDYAGNKY